MVCLFLTRRDQYFVMYKDSNVFQFTNFTVEAKYNNTVVYFVNSNSLFSRGKREKKLFKQFFDEIYCLAINIPPKLDYFWRES